METAVDLRQQKRADDTSVPGCIAAEPRAVRFHDPGDCIQGNRQDGGLQVIGQAAFPHVDKDACKARSGGRKADQGQAEGGLLEPSGRCAPKPDAASEQGGGDEPDGHKPERALDLLRAGKGDAA